MISTSNLSRYNLASHFPRHHEAGRTGLQRRPEGITSGCKCWWLCAYDCSIHLQFLGLTRQTDKTRSLYFWERISSSYLEKALSDIILGWLDPYARGPSQLPDTVQSTIFSGPIALNRQCASIGPKTSYDALLPSCPSGKNFAGGIGRVLAAGDVGMGRT